MMFENIRHWWQETRRAAQARAWVHSEGVGVVAQAMFHLNRSVRYGAIQGGQRYTIYGMKSRLIQVLYEQGYCSGVASHVQTYECWSCDGTGIHHSGDICWKCGGTGVHKRTNLYLFFFQVDGRRYSWHQAESYTNFPVTLSSSIPHREYEPRAVAADYVVHPREALDIYADVVRCYLIEQGVNPRVLPQTYTFRQALRDTFNENRIVRSISNWRNELRWRSANRQSDIPF